MLTEKLHEATVPAPPPAEFVVRSAGLRVTRPRIAVMEAVRGQPHSDTDQVLSIVRQTLPSVSRQAVYDVLGALTTAHLIRRIQPAGHSARYETRVGDNHHHLICRTCGFIEDTDCDSAERPCLTASETRGFRLDEAEIVFWGLCPDCTAATTPRYTVQLSKGTP